MKTSDTASLARGLLSAARRDGPTAAQRSRIWDQIAFAPHLVVVAPLAAEAARTSFAPAAKAVSAGISAGKMLLVGALAGSALTAGLGLMLRAPAQGHVVRTSEMVRTGERVVAQPVAEPAWEVPSPEQGVETTPAAAPEALRSHGVAFRAELLRAKKATPPVEVTPDDALLREAALVSRARTAIVHGHAADALAALDVAAGDPSHSLEPEELSLRVRALHALGRDAEASAVEVSLKARYPGNVLLGN